MSTENIAPVQSATTNATDRTSETGKSKAQQRAELASLAAEFESMLLMNMLRDMRTSGRWSTGGESGGEKLGADTFDSTFDTEPRSRDGQGVARCQGQLPAPRNSDRELSERRMALSAGDIFDVIEHDGRRRADRLDRIHEGRDDPDASPFCRDQL